MRAVDTRAEQHSRIGRYHLQSLKSQKIRRPLDSLTTTLHEYSQKVQITIAKKSKTRLNQVGSSSETADLQAFQSVLLSSIDDIERFRFLNRLLMAEIVACILLRLSCNVGSRVDLHRSLDSGIMQHTKHKAKQSVLDQNTSRANEYIL